MENNIKLELVRYLKNQKLEKIQQIQKIEFKDILAYGDSKTAEIGSPNIDGAKVEANIVKNGKSRTVLIFKKEEEKIQEKKRSSTKIFH